MDVAWPPSCQLSLSAARGDEGAKPDYDPRYIRPAEGEYATRLFMGHRTVHFSLDRDGDLHNDSDDVVRYSSNVGFASGFEIDWNGSSFAYTGAPEDPSRDPAVYGQARYDEVSWSLFRRRVSLDLYWYRSRGLYHEYTDDATGESEVFRRDDIEVTSFGCNAYYALNYRRFSLRAAYVGDEQQLSEAGSIVFVGSVHGHQVDADRPILPAHAQPTYRSFALLESFTSKGAGAGVGYGHIWVHPASGGEWRFFLVSCL
jgi:hypothetical protein